MLVAAACCAVVVSAVVVSVSTAGQSATEAEYLASIAHLREQSIKDGMIYGDTLLRFDKLDAYIEFRGGAERATDFYNMKESWKDITNDTRYIPLANFGVFIGDPSIFPDNIAALVIGAQMAEGTYTEPTEDTLRRYHEWMLDYYDVRPDTASAQLDEMTGDMRPLASEVLDILEARAVEGKVPSNLFFSDTDFWGCAAGRHYDNGDWTCPFDFAQYAADASQAPSLDPPDGTEVTTTRHYSSIYLYNCGYVGSEAC